MKEILIIGYLRQNVGDDIFVTELLNRYPYVKFHIKVLKKEYAKPFKMKKNLIIEIVKEENFENIEIDNYDGYIYIGGSIFMEGGKVYNLDEGCYNFIKKCKELEKPFFYISSNYGPYKTKEYFELSKKTFNLCTDLCFRDIYSYKLFSDIPTIRYAPDLVFSCKYNHIEKEKDTIGISVIDLSIRNGLKEKEEEYIEFLNNNITKYIQSNKKVYLFSFCEYEGDKIIIEKLYSDRKEDFKNKKIEIVNYKNNLKEFIDKYRKMEYMICARFHSLILSYIFEQKFFVLSYSNKISNVIKELKLCNNYLKFEDIESDKIIELENYNNVDKKRLEKLKRKAEKQFEKIDEFIEKE